MAFTSAIRSTGPDTRTSARSVARLTATLSTPSTFASAASTRPTQDAQVMPSTGRVIVVGPAATSVALAGRACVPGEPSRATARFVSGVVEDASIMASSLNLANVGRSSRGANQPLGNRLARRGGEAVGMAVHDVAVRAHEGHQREPAGLGQLDRQRGRRGNRRQQADPEPRRLGHHLVAGAAGDEHEAAPHVDPLADERAEQLVERIVAADVLSHMQDLALRRGPGRRMDRAARARASAPGASSRPSGTGGAGRITSSSRRLPHRPQPLRPGSRRASSGDRLTGTVAETAMSITWPASCACIRTAWMSLALATRSSLSEKPYAKSSRSSGVAIITAKVAPL